LESSLDRSALPNIGLCPAGSGLVQVLDAETSHDHKAGTSGTGSGGSGSYSVATGQDAKITLKLNKHGKQLLDRFYRVSAVDEPR
jgi:hypothetical protein